jgi:hypothetical protein
MSFQRLPSPSTLLGLFLAFLQALPAGAGTIAFSRGALNARSSLNFVGQKNVRATVPKGSTGEVLERWELPSGNYGIKVKLTTLGEGGTSLKTGEEVWVYYHQDPALRRVELTDDEGKIVENADEGKWAVALSTFRIQTSAPLPTAPAVEAETVCEDCNTNPVSQLVTQPIAPLQTLSLASVVESVNAELEANPPPGIPNLDTGLEEVLAFIAKDQKASLSRRHYKTVTPETNLIIARTLVDEAAKYDVPVSLVLGMIQKESHFYTKAHSGAGARGIMQIMPATYRDATGGKTDYTQLYDPIINIQIGIKVIASHLKYFKGDVKAALAAYNMGRAGYLQYLAGKRSLPSETRKYIPKVIAYQNAYIEYEKASRTTLSIASNSQ